MWPNPQFSEEILIEEILNGKLHFLYSDLFLSPVLSMKLLLMDRHENEMFVGLNCVFLVPNDFSSTNAIYVFL